MLSSYAKFFAEHNVFNWMSYVALDLSYQAAQRVMAADDDEKLAVLKEISQNFPVQTRSV